MARIPDDDTWQALRVFDSWAGAERCAVDQFLLKRARGWIREVYTIEAIPEKDRGQADRGWLAHCKKMVRIINDLRLQNHPLLRKAPLQLRGE
jgi:hypothetical protein